MEKGGSREFPAAQCSISHIIVDTREAIGGTGEVFPEQEDLLFPEEGNS